MVKRALVIIVVFVAIAGVAWSQFRGPAQSVTSSPPADTSCGDTEIGLIVSQGDDMGKTYCCTDTTCGSPPCWELCGPAELEIWDTVEAFIRLASSPGGQPVFEFKHNVGSDLPEAYLGTAGAGTELRIMGESTVVTGEGNGYIIASVKNLGSSNAYVEFNHGTTFLENFNGVGGTFAAALQANSVTADAFIKLTVQGSEGICTSFERGQLKTIDGGAGVADQLVACLKTSSDTYNWILVADGG